MGAVLDQTTAVAHVVNGAVRILHSFHHMVDIKIAIDRFDAVAHNIAVIVAAAANVPAIGQRVAQRQHISVLQIYRGHGLAGIIRTVQ